MSSLPKSRSRLNHEDDGCGRSYISDSRNRPAPPNESHKLARRGLRIGRTSVGKGVFATRKIVDGTCLGEIEGEVILDDSYESRYSFDLEGGGQLEPAPPFRFVNHSCEPNCAFELIEVSPACENQPHRPNGTGSNGTGSNGTGSNGAGPKIISRKLLLFAICDIEIGDELSIDYNWPAAYAIKCQCKAPSCRGWIVDPKHLAPLE